MVQFERFTERAQEAAQRAIEIIQHYGHNQIDTEHILLALFEQSDGTIPKILEILNISAQTITESLDRTLRIAPKSNLFGGEEEQIFISPRVKRIIDLANDKANHFEDEQISTEHIFLAILSEQGTPAARALKKASLTREQVYDAIQQIRNQMNLQEKDMEKKESYGKSVFQTSSKKSTMAMKRTFNRVSNNIKYGLEERQSLQVFNEVEGLMPMVVIIIAGVLAYLSIFKSDIWLALVAVILVPGILLVSLLVSHFRKCNRQIQIKILDVNRNIRSKYYPPETEIIPVYKYVSKYLFGLIKEEVPYGYAKEAWRYNDKVEEVYIGTREIHHDSYNFVVIEYHIKVDAKLECPKCYCIWNLTYPVRNHVSQGNCSEPEYKALIEEDIKNYIVQNVSSQ